MEQQNDEVNTSEHHSTKQENNLLLCSSQLIPHLESSGIRPSEAQHIATQLDIIDLTELAQHSIEEFRTVITSTTTIQGKLTQNLIYQALQDVLSASNNYSTTTTTAPKKSTAIPFSTTKKPYRTLIKHKYRVLAADFTPDCKLLFTAGADKRVGVWSTLDGKHLQWLIGHSDEVSSVSVCPKGTYVATAGKSQMNHPVELIIWSIHENKFSNVAHFLDNTFRGNYHHDSPDIHFHPTDPILAIDCLVGILLYKANGDDYSQSNWSELSCIRLPKERYKFCYTSGYLSFIPPSMGAGNYCLLSVRWESEFSSIEVSSTSGEEVKRQKFLVPQIVLAPQRYNCNTNCAIFSQVCDGILSGSRDGSIWLWNHENGEIVRQHSHVHEAECGIVRMSLVVSSTMLLTGGGDGTIRAWHLPEMTPHHRWQHHGLGKTVTRHRYARSSFFMRADCSGFWLATIVDDENMVKVWVA
jgi:WD40 repeat protein